MTAQIEILVLNGPNLNMLGIREPSIYGMQTLDDINEQLKTMAKNAGRSVAFFQSNHEGALIDRIHEAYDNTRIILINAGALTHTSLALYDAFKAVSIPFIEVHLSNPNQRESFRQVSYLTPIALGGIFGFGASSYTLAMQAALDWLKQKDI